MARSALTEARKNKSDEFYTQWADIEREVTSFLAEPGKMTIADIIGVGDFVIDKYEENDEELVLVTANGKEIIIDKFVLYCVCNIGEYIDKITPDGKISGVINPVTGSVEYVWHLGFTATNKPEVRPNYYYDNLELATTACF